MQQYDHTAIEKKWRKVWEENGIYTIPDTAAGRDNYYTLIEFPYPSGNLHIGHWYAFAVPDIFARYKRMKGFNVLYPIGFDAFGLPAENAAIKHKLNPREWTFGNIEHMRAQLRTMGSSFDWSREVVTADPSYYKWTQWLFIQFFNKGLAYQKDTEVNWCPSCKTVLANEQVIAGQCERCGSAVEKRLMKQWNLKITEYAERLLKDLETVDYPLPIKEAQRNWIGKSVGAEVGFTVAFEKEGAKEGRIPVFTTRPDTIFGATYMVFSPEHPWVKLAIDDDHDVLTNKEEVRVYVAAAGAKGDIERTAQGKEKTGVRLEGVWAINSATKEKIPMYVADYVLAHYGTGAVMGVPAHDERDFAFAKKYDLPIRQVIHTDSELPYAGEGILTNSDGFDGTHSSEVRNNITKAVEGKPTTTYKMRDWVVSRQRYWGCPIPIIHCAKCGPVPVPENELPVVLPEIDDFLPAGDGKSPLAKVAEWRDATCPSCGGKGERETDTLDTFIDSSWYYLRYTDPHNEATFAAHEKQNHWMPVDFYSGGAEHTTMHLLYSRFFHKVLFDLGLVADVEPYRRRMNRGIILGPDGNKMSKSKGNVIDPDDIVLRLGADTMRMYLAFIGPYNEVGAYPWSSDGIIGARRFIERVWRLFEKIGGEKVLEETERVLHQTIKKVTEEIESFKFNTAVSALMICVNVLEKEARIPKETFETLVRIVAPFAPFLTEELWHELGHDTSIHAAAWPEHDPLKLAGSEVTIAIQVNGRLRGSIEVARDTDEATALGIARGDESLEKWLNGKDIIKVIYVPNRVLNLVVRDA
jgi:leucyl-tRNA synthetase